MVPLKNVVQKIMSGYAVEGLNGFSVLTSSADGSLWTIVSTAIVNGKRLTTTSLIARIENDRVFIDHDINNKPLVDALVEAGVSRENIILTYINDQVSAAS
jgi:hypothetical protein